MLNTHLILLFASSARPAHYHRFVVMLRLRWAEVLHILQEPHLHAPRFNWIADIWRIFAMFNTTQHPSYAPSTAELAGWWHSLPEEQRRNLVHGLPVTWSAGGHVSPNY